VKRLSRILVLCAGLSFAGLTVRAEGMGPTVLDKGLFSYQAPAGWTVPEMNLSHPVALGPMKDGFAPNIHVDIKPNARPVSAYVADNMRAAGAAFPDFKLIDQRPFTTVAGLDGIRVVITDTVGQFHLQQIFYFFDGGSNQILVIGACCLAKDGASEAPLFDASIKTFTLE
jgi:hypothetical protein